MAQTNSEYDPMGMTGKSGKSGKRKSKKKAKGKKSNKSKAKVEEDYDNINEEEEY